MLPPPFSNALVLTGPTGSGKTQLGIELAQRLDAEIISMDSMALYRGLDIGTAKPTPAQRRLVPHHLIDVLDPWESASVAWWLEQARACCRDIEGRGRQALFVGGTPLYLKALCCGLFDGPPADAARRRRLEAEAVAAGGPAALHARLEQVDPIAAARLHPNDQRRIIRALEVFEATGRPISAWQREWDREAEGRGRKSEGRGQKSEVRGQQTAEATPDSCSLTPDSCLLTPDSCSLPPVLWLDVPRPELYVRINRRVEAMFAAGLVDEVRQLRSARRPLSKEASQALGYKEVLAHLAGTRDLEATVALVQTRTRNFAKRQVTWFRRLPGCLPTTSQLTWGRWHPKMK
ncbi:MAG: tRNA (adenosine(37)-N6)-dimethylallyltransferase MiaA [Gemmataceae bacterium]|nr:tRNA (adenosine(37)-N6)-dimethylallyltransferase MiaA [Gemmataceae bacterium]